MLFMALHWCDNPVFDRFLSVMLKTPQYLGELQLTVNATRPWLGKFVAMRWVGDLPATKKTLSQFACNSAYQETNYFRMCGKE